MTTQFQRSQQRLLMLAVALGLVGFIALSIFISSAFAHTGGITFGCRDGKPYVAANLTSYNGTNTISIVVDGKELTPGTFGSSYVKTFTEFDAIVAHTGSYAVKAHDDAGHPEWSPSGPISIPACSSPPTTTGATTSTSSSTTVASTVPPSSAPATTTSLPAADSTSTSAAPATTTPCADGYSRAEDGSCVPPGFYDTTVPVCDPATHYVAPSGDCVNLPLCEKEPLAPQCAPLDTSVTPLPIGSNPGSSSVAPPPDLAGTLPATGLKGSTLELELTLVGCALLLAVVLVLGARRPKATKQ